MDNHADPYHPYATEMVTIRTGDPRLAAHFVNGAKRKRGVNWADRKWLVQTISWVSVRNFPGRINYLIEIIAPLPAPAPVKAKKKRARR